MILDYFKTVINTINPFAENADDVLALNESLDDLDEDMHSNSDSPQMHDLFFEPVSESSSSTIQEEGLASRFVDFVVDRFEGTSLGDLLLSHEDNLEVIMTKLVANAMAEPDEFESSHNDIPNDLIVSNSLDQQADDDQDLDLDLMFNLDHEFSITSDSDTEGAIFDHYNDSFLSYEIPQEQDDDSEYYLQYKDNQQGDDIVGLGYFGKSEQKIDPDGIDPLQDFIQRSFDELNQAANQDEPEQTSGISPVQEPVILNENTNGLQVFQIAGDEQGTLNQGHEKSVIADNDDILQISEDHEDLSGFFSGSTVNFNALNQLTDNLSDLNVANDMGNNVKLDATDILDLGNSLIITGDVLDSVEFEDGGWTKLDQNAPLPQGIEFREGYDTFIHESGAVVQIDHIIQTNYHDGYEQ